MFKFEFCLSTMGKVCPRRLSGFTKSNITASGLRLERDGDRVSLITRGGYDWTKPKLSNR